MSTSKKLQELESIEFITKEQAFDLGKMAIKEFSKRSKAAKNVESAMWNIALAGGCPNAVRSAVISLTEKYSADQSYVMNCSNGWSATINAKSLKAAKAKATKLATHGCGSYSITEPDGTIHGREMWQNLNRFGWNAWAKSEQY